MIRFFLLLLFPVFTFAQGLIPITYIDQQGDDYQLYIPFDLGLYPAPEIIRNQQAEQDTIALAPNDFLPGQNFALQSDGTVSSSVLDLLQPNQTYSFLFVDSGEEVAFETDENAIPDFVPSTPPPVISSSTDVARLADATEAFVLSWYFALGFGLVLAVFILFPTRTRYDY